MLEQYRIIDYFISPNEAYNRLENMLKWTLCEFCKNNCVLNITINTAVFCCLLLPEWFNTDLSAFCSSIHCSRAEIEELCRQTIMRHFL